MHSESHKCDVVVGNQINKNPFPVYDFVDEQVQSILPIKFQVI